MTVSVRLVKGNLVDHSIVQIRRHTPLQGHTLDHCMTLTVYQVKYLAYELTRRGPANSIEKFAGTLADAKVDMNPHQVEAALFAFKSPLSRGAILADEVGLGKTIEAGIVLSQFWAEGKNRILLLVPASLRKQWQNELTDKFYLPSTILEGPSFNKSRKAGISNPFDTTSAAAPQIVICSHPFAAGKDDFLMRTPWDLVVIDEAHRLPIVTASITRWPKPSSGRPKTSPPLRRTSCSTIPALPANPPSSRNSPAAKAPWPRVCSPSPQAPRPVHRPTRTCSCLRRLKTTAANFPSRKSISCLACLSVSPVVIRRSRNLSICGSTKASNPNWTDSPHATSNSSSRKLTNWIIEQMTAERLSRVALMKSTPKRKRLKSRHAKPHRYPKDLPCKKCCAPLKRSAPRLGKLMMRKAGELSNRGIRFKPKRCSC